MTLRPAAFNWRALSVTAMVGDGLMRLRWSARKAIGSSEVPVETRVFGRRFGPIMRRRQVARTDRSINAVDGPPGTGRQAAGPGQFAACRRASTAWPAAGNLSL